VNVDIVSLGCPTYQSGQLHRGQIADGSQVHAFGIDEWIENVVAIAKDAELHASHHRKEGACLVLVDFHWEAHPCHAGE
jgi:hypothetical protein